MSTSNEPSSGADIARVRPRKEIRNPWLIEVISIVVVALAGLGIWHVLADDGGPEGDANAFEPGTVTVSISGIDDAAGSYLAGVLFQGELAFDNAIGGFAVEVDSDSFATSQVVREPQPDPDYDNALFPYVSQKPLVVESDSYLLQLWFSASEMGPYNRWVPGATAGLSGCEMQFSIDAGSAVHLTLTDVPSEGTEVSLTCPAASWETTPASKTFSSSGLQEEEWRIALNDGGSDIHTVLMIRTFSPLREAEVQDLGGRLVWEEAEIDLCGIGIRSVGDGSLQIGDIFQTTEGCDTNTGMQQAFEDFGLPETACVFVRANGVDDEHCAPLAVD